MTVDTTIRITNNTYDEVPYQSYPYAQSQPEYLHTYGMLFGMTPPSLETARVLELGCAEGGNLIPHALNYPKASFVGVDLSKVQIDTGLENVKTLGLTNVELKHMSITDIDESFGKFDYIICHGVISWVPEFVRERIFEICSKNLVENGIAYVSYNTLPGWNMIRTIRDMMLYHSQMFTSTQDKVTQSRLLLKFITDSLEGQTSPYAEILRQETKLLSQQSDHYLRHDHLEEENKQFYFHEFMSLASAQGLQYLSDSSLSSMYIGNMPDSVSAKLKDINDMVRTEQYMDFITNRRFRSTMLCHSSVPLKRSLTNDIIKHFAITLNVTPELEAKEDVINGAQPLKFFFNNNKDTFISANSPALKAALSVLSENPYRPLTIDTIVKKSLERLVGVSKEQVEVDLLNNSMNLVIKGYISLYSIERDITASVDMPKSSPMAYHQAAKTANNWVTNLLHQTIGINSFEKILLSYMDGSRNKEQLCNLIVKDVQAGKLTVHKDGAVLIKESELKVEIEKFIEITINKMMNQALLV